MGATIEVDRDGVLGHNAVALAITSKLLIIWRPSHSLAEGGIGTIQFDQLDVFTLGCLPTSKRGPRRARPSTESAACTIAASLCLLTHVLCASARENTRLGR